MLVVDTSVIIAVILNEESKEALIDVTVGEELIAPQSLHWELCNAFSAMFKQNRLTLLEAQQALELYYHIPIRLRDISLSQALTLAQKLNIYAYDAYMLTLAQHSQSPLLSLDKRLVAVAKLMHIPIVEVAI